MNKDFLNKWVLLIGGSNSGKTTLLEELAARGYNTKAEASHEIIMQYIERDVPFIDMMKDPVVALQFQEDVAAAEMERESQIEPHMLTFFDRVCIDYIVMTRMRKLQANPRTLKKMEGRTYALALMLEMIPGTSDVKLESALDDPTAEARRQEPEYRKVMEEYGIEVKDIQRMDVAKRADVVIKECKARGLIKN